MEQDLIYTEKLYDYYFTEKLYSNPSGLFNIMHESGVATEHFKKAS